MEKRGVKYHRGRLGEALREEIETLVEGELADPRIGLVRVTAVHVADDGRSAQVLVDVDGDDRKRSGVLRACWPRKNTYGTNWWSVCGGDARQNCISGWTVRSGRKRE